MASPFTVSSASAADYPAFARLFLELVVPDPVPSAERFAESIAPQAILLRDGDAVVGYAWARPRGERLHIVHVITDPAHRRRGVGRALMDALAGRGRAAGIRRWMLNVKPENVAARELYVGCGMQVVLEGVSVRLAWADVARLPPSPGVETRSLAPADDARFEDALGLTRGDFTVSRALPGRVFVGAEADGRAVGCVAFDPSFPGASVFRVSAPGHARALLEAIHPHALPQHDRLLVFSEGDPALAAALLGAGAEVVLRVLRMEGDIPPPLAPMAI
jgi:ribosomal-protein-alanine N-acetyltransferase